MTQHISLKSWTTKSGVEIHRVLQGRCNGYLVSKENRFLMVDTGRKADWRKLDGRLERLGVTETTSIALALTHCHFDHAENAARFKATFHAPILVHRSEEALLKSGDNPEIRGTMLFIRALSWLLSRGSIAARLRYDPVGGDVPVDEDLRLESYGIPGYLLHTPGHTPGSMSAIIDDEIAIVGDAMFGVFPDSKPFS